MRISKLLVFVPALALVLAGCKEEGVEGPLAACQPVSFASFCSSDAECCSFGCVMGSCIANPLEGGVCKTHGDCAGGRLCIGQRCSSAVSCVPSLGACTAGVPCCNGTCTVGGYCPVDNPPVAVPGRTTASNPAPIRIPIQLTNASYDPDVAGSGVGLSYTWSVIAPNGSTATFQPSAAYFAPRFTPDVAGTYTITLRAQNAGGRDDTSISFQAVNTAPAATVDPLVATTTKSRNIGFEFTVPVSDADGGPVTCAWSKIPPGETDPIGVTSATRCAGATGVAAQGGTTITFKEDLEGVWTMRLTTSDDAPANEKNWDFQITVVNDRPTIDAMPQRVGNFGAPGGVVPPIQLHAVVHDKNEDVERGNITYSWTLAAKPADGEPRAIGAVVGTGPDPQFVPSAVGAYQIKVDVDDQHSYGTASAYVDVLVEPYILPLGEVMAAAHHKNSNRVVAVGKSIDGTTNRLWVIDPTVPEILHDVALAATPTCVALSFDGEDALVGETGGWQLVTGIQTTPTAGAQRGFYEEGVLQSAEASAIVHFTAPNGARRGFATASGGRAFELFLGNTTAPFSARASCPSCTTTEAPRGTRIAANPTTLWLLDSDGQLARYAVSQSNFNLSFGAATANPALTGTGARGLWLGADGLDLFTTTRNVYAADTLVARTDDLDAARDHVDTTLNGGLKGISAVWTSSMLTRFGATFADAGTLQLPQIGRNGTGYPALGRFAFVKQDEGGFYTIVRANTGTWEWGLAKTP